MKPRLCRIISVLLTITLLTSFCSQTLAATLQLPDGLTVIEEYAFQGDTSLDEVHLPDGISRIESGAFADSSLRSINLPSSLSYIADDALPGPDQVHVEAEEGTGAWQWAVDKGYITSMAFTQDECYRTTTDRAAFQDDPEAGLSHEGWIRNYEIAGYETLRETKNGDPQWNVEIIGDAHGAWLDYQVDPWNEGENRLVSVSMENEPAEPCVVEFKVTCTWDGETLVGYNTLVYQTTALPTGIDGPDEYEGLRINEPYAFHINVLPEGYSFGDFAYAEVWTDLACDNWEEWIDGECVRFITPYQAGTYYAWVVKRHNNIRMQKRVLLRVQDENGVVPETVPVFASQDDIEYNIAVVPEALLDQGIYADNWIENFFVTNAETLGLLYGPAEWTVERLSGESLGERINDEGQYGQLILDRPPVTPESVGVREYRVTCTWGGQSASRLITLNVIQPESLPSGVILRDSEGNEIQEIYMQAGDTFHLSSEFDPYGWQLEGRSDRQGFDMWSDNGELTLYFDGYTGSVYAEEPGDYTVYSNTRSGNVLGYREIPVHVSERMSTDDYIDILTDDEEIGCLVEEFDFSVYSAEESAELRAAMADYEAQIQSISEQLNELAEEMLSGAVSLDDSNLSLSLGSLNYNLDSALNSAGAEIVSTQLVGNSLQLEVSSNGTLSYITLNSSGASVSGSPMSGGMRSRGADRRTELEKLYDHFSTVVSWVNRVNNVIDGIEVIIKKAVGSAERVLKAAEEMYDLNCDTPGTLGIQCRMDLQKARDQLAKVTKAQRTWSKFCNAGGVIGIGCDFATILDCYTKFQTRVRPLVNHGHPTDQETADPYLASLSEELNDECFSAAVSLSIQGVTSMISMFVEISRLLAMIAAAVPGAQPAAATVTLGTLAAKLIMNIIIQCWGSHLNNLADQSINKARINDEILHTVIYGTVKELETEKPLENVQITDGNLEVFTDSAGRFELHVEAGYHRFTCNLHGYKEGVIEVTVEANQRLPHDVELKPKTLILTREDLEAVAEDPDDDYIVGADIDLSEEPWTPLPVLRGSIDGDGYTISGMHFTGEYSDTNIGLFNMLEGEITDLNMTGVSVNITAAGDHVNGFTFGQPDDLWTSGVANGTWKVSNCSVSATANITAVGACSVGFNPLAAAYMSSAAANINIYAQNVNQVMLWNCYKCTASGSMCLSSTAEPGGRMIMIKDSYGCTADVFLRVDHNDYPKGWITAIGIQSENTASRVNLVKGSIYCEAYAYAVDGGEKGAINCESQLLIQSNWMNGLINCTNSTLNGDLETIGNTSDVNVVFVDDLDHKEERNNTVNAGYIYGENEGIMPANLLIFSRFGAGSSINTPIILEDISLTNVNINLSTNDFHEDLTENDWQNQRYRNGIISVKTNTGNITIYSDLATGQNTYAESNSGSVSINAASYNTGNVTGKTNIGNLTVTGGSKYNSGPVLGVSTGGQAGTTSYVNGVCCSNGFNEGPVLGINYGSGIMSVNGINGSNGWNEGDVTAENRGQGAVCADGVYGENGVNKGTVLAQGYDSSDNDANGNSGWNVIAKGVDGISGWNSASVTASSSGDAHVMAVGCEGGVNIGTVTSNASGGYANASGIIYGGKNAGPVSATTSSGSVARAWGAKSGGSNSADVRGICNRGGMATDAYADAQGGTAYASGGKGFASGRYATGHSLYTGQTVTNGQYGHKIAVHYCKDPQNCSAAVYVINTSRSYATSTHTYALWCSAELTGESPAVINEPEPERQIRIPAGLIGQ